MLAIPCLCLFPCMLESVVPPPSSEQSMMLHDDVFEPILIQTQGFFPQQVFVPNQALKLSVPCEGPSQTSLHDHIRGQCVRATFLGGSKACWDASVLGWPSAPCSTPPFSGVQLPPPCPSSHCLTQSPFHHISSCLKYPLTGKKDDILEVINIQGIYISASYACTFVI